MATEVQAGVAMVLSDLMFESVPGGMPGSPAKFKVTEDGDRGYREVSQVNH